MAAFREEVKPVAVERIQRALFLVEFGKAENVEVKPEELEKQAISTMNYLYGTLDEKDQKKLMSREVQNNIIGNVLADMLSQRALEKFRNVARGIAEEQTGEEEATPATDGTPSETPETATATTDTAAVEPATAEQATEAAPAADSASFEAALTDNEPSPAEGAAPASEDVQQETE
jgi:hypothetical protein